MSDRKLLGIGLGGGALAEVCCFTPALAGPSAWLAWLDYVLLPAFILFLAITGYALVRTRKT